MSGGKLQVHVYNRGGTTSDVVIEVDENDKIVIGGKEFNLKEIGQISIADKDRGYTPEKILEAFGNKK